MPVRSESSLEPVEFGMLQLGNEHGGYAMDGGAPLSFHGHQGLARVEVLRRHHHGRSGGGAGQGAQHRTEAVVEGHGDAETVLFGEPQTLGGVGGVGHQVVVGKHHALGVAGGAGSVHDADNVVRVAVGLAAGQGLNANFRAQVLHVVPRKHAGGSRAIRPVVGRDVNDMAQCG